MDDTSRFSSTNSTLPTTYRPVESNHPLEDGEKMVFRASVMARMADVTRPMKLTKPSMGANMGMGMAREWYRDALGRIFRFKNRLHSCNSAHTSSSDRGTTMTATRDGDGE